MNNVNTLLWEEIRKDHEYVTGLRRHFHRYPEVALEEYRTTEKIEEELDKIGVRHQRFSPELIKTGVYAEIEGLKGKGNTILLRADIDALPIKEERESDYKSTVEGKMHACGHDGHTASLIGAARILQRHRDLFPGKVILIFQPAEETGNGGKAIADAGGYASRTDRTFGMHAAPELPTGTICVMPGPNNASVDLFEVTVTGKGAHVSTPHKGIDTVYIASEMIVALQSLVTRMSDPMKPLLIGVGSVHGGNAYNIVADRTVFSGTIRAFDEDLRALTKKRLSELTENIAKTYGASVSIRWADNAPVLINDEESSKEAQKIAEKLVGPEHVITSRTPNMQGDDFAEYNRKTPGVYAYVGTGNAERPETCLPLHSACFDIDENALNYTVGMHVLYAVSYLNNFTEE
ncbi:MAG: amidohydrolase [Erysipelotrichales bacterium]|nr:amidohydrolase [Erysipelotrichales bacterium]